MIYNLILDKELLTLNKYINIERTNKYKAATEKKKQHNDIILLAKSERFKLPVNTLFYVIIEWYNYKEDSDNVEFCQKFIFDALQEGGFLQNDSKKFIKHKIHLHYKNSITKSKYQVIRFIDNKDEFFECFKNKML